MTGLVEFEDFFLNTGSHKVNVVDDLEAGIAASSERHVWNHICLSASGGIADVNTSFASVVEHVIGSEDVLHLFGGLIEVDVDSIFITIVNLIIFALVKLIVSTGELFSNNLEGSLTALAPVISSCVDVCLSRAGSDAALVVALLGLGLINLAIGVQIAFVK